MLNLAVDMMNVVCGREEQTGVELVPGLLDEIAGAALALQKMSRNAEGEFSDFADQWLNPHTHKGKLFSETIALEIEQRQEGKVDRNPENAMTRLAMEMVEYHTGSREIPNEVHKGIQKALKFLEMRDEDSVGRKADENERLGNFKDYDTPLFRDGNADFDERYERAQKRLMILENPLSAASPAKNPAEAGVLAHHEMNLSSFENAKLAREARVLFLADQDYAYFRGIQKPLEVNSVQMALRAAAFIGVMEDASRDKWNDLSTNTKLVQGKLSEVNRDKQVELFLTINNSERLSPLHSVMMGQRAIDLDRSLLLSKDQFQETHKNRQITQSFGRSSAEI
jgi:hypothetical protein